MVAEKIYVVADCARPPDPSAGLLACTKPGYLAWLLGVHEQRTASWVRLGSHPPASSRRGKCAHDRHVQRVPLVVRMRQGPRSKTNSKRPSWTDATGVTSTTRDPGSRLGSSPEPKRAGHSLPLVVAERMQRRMVAFAGVPFFLGIGAFGFFFLLKYKYDIVVIPPVVGYATLGLFGVSLFGLTYGIMSASWDPARVGTLLGWEEAQRNFISTVDGFWRARIQERLHNAGADDDDATSTEDESGTS
jgi:hypothetical protein